MMNRRLLDLRRRPKIAFKSQRPSFWELLEVLHQPAPHSAVPNFNAETQALEIRFAEGGKRIRKVVRRSNYRMTGKYSSLKNGRMMQWESSNEKMAFEILEAHPMVASYCEQPAEIRYRDELENERLHYPDILVEMKSGSRGFLEIKPESDADDPELMVRTTLLSKQLQVKGYSYFLVTSDQIESEEYLANAQHLVHQSRRVKTVPPWEIIRKAFQSQASLTLTTLIKQLNHPSARSWVCKLILAGDLVFDQSQPFDGETLINWIQGA